MNDLIVAINAGSATVKFAGYEVCGNSAVVQRVNRGIAEFTSDGARFSVIIEHDAAIVNHPIHIRSRQSSDIQGLLDHAVQWLKTHSTESVIALGHRVVHGGDAFSEPILLNDANLA